MGDYPLTVNNLVRSAKSDNDWNDHNHIAFNTTVSSLLPADFFPTPDPSLDHIDPAILNSPLGSNPNLAISGVSPRYLDYLDLATRVPQECFILDFAAETLRLLGFEERRAFVFQRYSIPLTIPGEADPVDQTGICIIHAHPTLVLLVLVIAKTLTNEAGPETQVAATAITAFRFNNKMREDHGLNPLDAMIIPCITMANTCPIFYLVPVTTALINTVIGQCPSSQSQVLRCPTVTTSNAGMEDTEYRKLVLKRLLAFKALARSHLVHILEGV